MDFEIVDIEQGTMDWLKWRAGGIGASEAPTVMRENPWKTLGELQQEKLRPRFNRPVNAAMARGTALEPMARAYYCDRRKIDVEPACIQSLIYPWMRASLDGINFDKNMAVEIKCGESVYKKTSYTRTVPEYYYGQLQHILSVTGYKAIDFWCYLPEKRPVLIDVRRNESYIARLIEQEQEFWEFIEADVLKALAATD